MTSDKTKTAAPSSARIQLAYACGEHRVNLKELTEDELSKFLFEKLGEVELRELRGFTPIWDLLSQDGDEPIRVADTCELLRASLFADSQLDETFSLRTQAVKVCRGVCFQRLTFKRHESGEETTDRDIARTWGKGVYVHSGVERILVLARLPNHSRAYENLVSLDYRFAKFPHERRYLIHSVTATSLSEENFCSFFGKDAPDIARDLLWELRTVHSRTLDELVNQTEKMRDKVNAWNKLGKKIA